MAQYTQDYPCIHVCLLSGVDESLYHWVEIGAEEEGVPTRKVKVSESDAVAAAFAAAQESRFDIGVSIAPNRVVLHEMHMPAHTPVLSFETGTDAQRICRLMGGNAARLVVRLPLRFADEEEEPIKESSRPRQARPAPIIQKESPASQPQTPKTTIPATDNPNRTEIEALARAIAAKIATLQVEPVNVAPPADILNQVDIKALAKAIARVIRERGIL
jgi:hypothetical protein